MFNSIDQQIAEADTPAKVWELVAALAQDSNNYPEHVYLGNIKAWANRALNS